MALASAHRASPAELFRRRRYYRKFIRPQPVPPHTISFLPDGFFVRQVANTGISIIDNFCTPDEALHLINSARDQLTPSTTVYKHTRTLSERRTSETATVFSKEKPNPIVTPLLYRGAMLMGIPYNHIEAVYVSRYQSGQQFEPHTDFCAGFQGDRLYTLLLYLNDLLPEQGGETIFHDLNVSIQPKRGRAITWTNKNPDESVHPETRHSARPVRGDAEKWVIQLWFRRYKMFDATVVANQEVPQTTMGKALKGDEFLPEGISTLASPSQ